MKLFSSKGQTLLDRYFEAAEQHAKLVGVDTDILGDIKTRALSVAADIHALRKDRGIISVEVDGIDLEQACREYRFDEFVHTMGLCNQVISNDAPSFDLVFNQARAARQHLEADLLIVPGLTTIAIRDMLAGMHLERERWCGHQVVMADGKAISYEAFRLAFQTKVIELVSLC